MAYSRLEIREMTSFFRFVSGTVNLVLNYLICTPMERFQIRSDMVKCWNSNDGTDRRIENKLIVDD